MVTVLWYRDVRMFGEHPYVMLHRMVSCSIGLVLTTTNSDPLCYD